MPVQWKSLAMKHQHVAARGELETRRARGARRRGRTGRALAVDGELGGGSVTGSSSLVACAGEGGAEHAREGREGPSWEDRGLPNRTAGPRAPLCEFTGHH